MTWIKATCVSPAQCRRRPPSGPSEPTDFRPDAMTPRFSPPAIVNPVLALALAGSSAGIVWYAVLMGAFRTAATLSPICGHAGAAGPHCAACYAALSLIVLGFSVAASRVASEGQGTPRRAR